MSVLNELLEYQKVDGELLKVEKEISSSEERKKYVQAKKFMETAREKLDSQESHAVHLHNSFNELTKRYEEVKNTIAEYDGVDSHVDDGGDVSFYKRSAQQLADSLKAIKAELLKLVASIEEAMAEYQKLKEQTIKMQKQYKEYKDKYNEVKGSRDEEVNAIKAKLAKIAANIPADTLEKYTVKRKEKINPVLVPLTNDRCMCGMDLPIAQQSRLSGGNVIECDHCHRFIYKQ